MFLKVKATGQVGLPYACSGFARISRVKEGGTRGLPPVASTSDLEALRTVGEKPEEPTRWLTPSFVCDTLTTTGRDPRPRVQGLSPKLSEHLQRRSLPSLEWA